MGRHPKSDLVMRNITDVARQLFLAQGYKATTTRQIIKKAGITTGTLYHFFRTKDDILLQITRETYNEAMGAVDAIVEEKGDSLLHYVLLYILEMKAVSKYAPIAEIYLQAYSSWHITNAMLPLHIKRNKALFATYNPHFDDQDYYLRTLALRGMELGFIVEQINVGKGDYAAKSAVLVRHGLSLFNIPHEVTEMAYRQALSLVAENTLNIQGFSI